MVEMLQFLVRKEEEVENTNEKKPRNPLIHSKSSVRLWGGTVDDYLPLHNKMDYSKIFQIIDIEH